MPKPMKKSKKKALSDFLSLAYKSHFLPNYMEKFEQLKNYYPPSI